MTARVTFGTDSSGTDHPLQANSAETELTATEIEMLTMDFLFADVAAKSTGPSGAQARSTLSFVKNVLTVRDKLWASAHLKPRVKARLADEKGRLDKEELLGHICNNALGRPLLPDGAARDVGQAANNAVKKEERLTAEAKAKHSVAISKAVLRRSKTRCSTRRSSKLRRPATPSSRRSLRRSTTCSSLTRR